MRELVFRLKPVDRRVGVFTRWNAIDVLVARGRFWYDSACL